MASRNAVVAVSLAAVSALLLAGCAGGDTGSDEGIDGDVKGEVTFVTWRTDLITDGTFDEYAAEFTKKYPEASVKFQGITDYEGELKTRLSTTNYGDVLGVPNSVQPDQLADFFEPLGETADLESDYRFLAPRSFEGTQYGLALGGNANGLVYNKKVFADAGITELPTSHDEFIDALKQVDEKTDAIPLYTNYKDGWPLSQWTGNLGAISGDPDAVNKMATDDAPWTEGTDIEAIDALVYDAVSEGLTEPDPLTTNWEQSKVDFATGKIGVMALGSWAISQFQGAATDAGTSPDDVGYMAFPATAPDGKQYAVIGGDYSLGINVHSKVKAAAKAWIDYLIEDSGFTDTQGMVSSLASSELPTNLAGLSDAGVELIELNPAEAGKESLVNNIADTAQIDIWGNIYRQKLVDIARGAADGDEASYFDQLNTQWADAIASVG
ncbi:extracellular solute-binding protein [Agromyces atrinae]|uniref:ABC-type glycerol-3-phosphate transport system substrate-binding protein n=1 Tax=Agromyces atrinae TaxID=592376 RepID=A0A4Q2M7E7_9MICO|nr:extracellular solute-binding protein [Agromyces atrinae]MCI2956705.1 extracellular solute-binding protein [Agromyces atrinae]NYD67937.1 ABC-type glycerol-3-phosphate transport system substrate-binding protein [Agromyces atrinae]RXZ87898.1 extracellular solute-binding protein [Agromyces atrinae]